MREALLLRLYLLLLILSLLWLISGAPVFAEEWQDLPHRFSLMAVQLPARLHDVFTHWR